ncbi:MAG: AroM family protein [Alphaproteobacteria bacterium]|nr:AroM family protein [Alphaproteobacteria bacterium]
MARTLGIAVIGQAPRADIAELFAAQAPQGTRIVMRGCLDGLDDAGIDALPPLDGGDALYTRLPSGRDARISKKAVIARAPDTLARLRADGADALVFNCTGAFPPMEGDAGVLFPSRVLAGLAAGLLPQGRLALLVPLPEQAAKLKDKWQRPGVDIVAEALAPSGEAAQAEAAALRLKEHRPDLVAMDCMSYTPQTKAAVKRVLGVPTLLAITATGRVLRELLD